MSPRCRSPAAAAGAGHCTHTQGGCHSRTHTYMHPAPRAPHPHCGYSNLVFASDHTLTRVTLASFCTAGTSTSHPRAHCSYWLLDLQPHIYTRQRHRESPDNWYQKPSFAQGQPLLSFYDSSCHSFLNSFLCKWSWAFPFLSFSFSTKHWILNLTLSPNALPLHLIVHPISIGNNLLQS